MTYAYAPRADDAAVLTHVAENPKSGKSAVRYACYAEGETVADYIRKCVERGLTANATKARADLRWDFDRGFIALALPVPADHPAYQA